MFTISLITIEYIFVFNSLYLILFTNNGILNDAFYKQLYLLDDPVHLPVDFAPTQTSSVPRGRTSISQRGDFNYNFQITTKIKKKPELLLSNQIYSTCSCFPNLLDDSWASKICELLASSSHSGDGCHFVGVKGSPISGSWSAVIEMDCCIQQTTIISLFQTWSWCSFKMRYRKQRWHCKLRHIF